MQAPDAEARYLSERGWFRVAGHAEGVLAGRTALRRGRPAALLWLALASLSAPVVTACLFRNQIGTERAPTVVGIVQDRHVASSNDLTVVLVDHSDVILPARSERLTAGSNPEPGTLLIADPSASEPWFVSLTRQGDCFLLLTSYAELRGGNIVTLEGLVLPLASTFHAAPAGDDGRFEGPRGSAICVNEQGQAVSAE